MEISFDLREKLDFSGLIWHNTSKEIPTKNNLKTLYLALIQPYISYGLLIWGNAN